MSNTITSQTLVDGSRNTVVKVTILADGSGEITSGIIFNASNFVGADVNNKLMRIQYNLRGFSGTLYWDANTPVQMMSLSGSFPADQCFEPYGGLINNAGAGKTGNILLTTDGLASLSGSAGEIILYVKKK